MSGGGRRNRIRAAQGRKKAAAACSTLANYGTETAPKYDGIVRTSSLSVMTENVMRAANENWNSSGYVQFLTPAELTLATYIAGMSGEIWNKWHDIYLRSKGIDPGAIRSSL